MKSSRVARKDPRNVKRSRGLVGLILMFALATSASAGTEKVLHAFTGGDDGGQPFDIGKVTRDSSGNLFGTTSEGGSCMYGTVFELATDGTMSVLHSFCGTEGTYPSSGVVLDPSGNIYGTTTYGDGYNCGTVFKLSGSALTTLHAFTCGTDGGKPYTPVILDKAGNVYGTATEGGANGWGVVFEVSSSGAYSVLYSFCSVSGCTDGASPFTGLVMDGNGNLLGCTTEGGTNDLGTVFKLSRYGGVWKETVLHSYAGGSMDGSDPYDGSLTILTLKAGNKRSTVIFGVTGSGGTSGNGTAFEMTKVKTGYTLRVLHSFSGSGGDGKYPYGTLTYAKGKLTGTTFEGGNGGYGTVFQLAPKKKAWTETVLYSFTDGSDGGYPSSGVATDSSGSFYGVTLQGGSSGFGVAYAVTP